MELPSAEFFDIFGFIGFVFIFIIAYKALYNPPAPRWMLVILLLIGIIGIVVDGWIVYDAFIR